ncbi:hypothetical protein T08_235, partial [Trichinella sp. T8]
LQNLLEHGLTAIVAGSRWMSFATGCVITLVDVRILADLAMPSLPKCNSVITPTRHWVAGCFPPISAPSHSLPERLWNISISIAASVLTDILVSNFATNSRGAADSITLCGSITRGHVLLAAILGHGLQLPERARTYDQSATQTVKKGGIRGFQPPRMSVVWH